MVDWISMQNKDRLTVLEVNSTPIQRKILEILLKTNRPLRPIEIQASLPEELRPQSSAKLIYHLEKLKLAKLVDNDKIHERLSLYTVSDKARLLFLQPQDRREKARYLAALVAPYSGKKNHEELVEAMMKLIE